MTTEKIIQIVSQVTGVESEILIGKGRKPNMVEARDIAILLFYKRTNLTLLQIGKHFNNRHHTTIMESRNRCWEVIDTNNKIAEKFKKCECLLND